MDFGSTSSTASGNFTRYGDVNTTSFNADDMYVIGNARRQSLSKVPHRNLAPLEEGMGKRLLFGCKLLVSKTHLELGLWFD